MNRNIVISYALAAVASVCFIGGIAILSGGRVNEHGSVKSHCCHTRRIV